MDRSGPFFVYYFAAAITDVNVDNVDVSNHGDWPIVGSLQSFYYFVILAKK